MGGAGLILGGGGYTGEMGSSKLGRAGEVMKKAGVKVKVKANMYGVK